MDTARSGVHVCQKVWPARARRSGSYPRFHAFDQWLPTTLLPAVPTAETTPLPAAPVWVMALVPAAPVWVMALVPAVPVWVMALVPTVPRLTCAVLRKPPRPPRRLPPKTPMLTRPGVILLPVFVTTFWSADADPAEPSASAAPRATVPVAIAAAAKYVRVLLMIVPFSKEFPTDCKLPHQMYRSLQRNHYELFNLSGGLRRFARA